MNDDRYSALLGDNKADLHIPTICPICGGKYRYVGVGEYECEKCHNSDMDDYGKVRNYIEKHADAKVTEVEAQTGVSKASINRLIIDGRIDVRRTKE